MADIFDRNSQIEVVRDFENSTFYNKTEVSVRVRGDKLEILNDLDAVQEQFTAIQIPDVVGDNIIKKAETIRTFIVSVVPEDVNISTDKQIASATDSQVTTSATFVDMPSMTLTTKDLGEAGVYYITASASVSDSTNNTVITIIINVDGVDVAASEAPIELDSAGVEERVRTDTLVGSLVAGKEIKIRWKTGGGTATVTSRELILIGTPESRIVN